MTGLATHAAEPLLRRTLRDTRIRHILGILIGAVLLVLFAMVHAAWSPMHRWNRAFGDVSLVLIAVSFSLGPVSRFFRPIVRFLPLRREFGIYACAFALIHTAIILFGWVEWDLMRLFGFEWHPDLRAYVMFQHGFGLSNALGLGALVLIALLAATSSDFALRKLGTSGWKFLQMGVLPLWWLTIAHVGYFLFVHFLSFHRAIPEPNPLRLWFVGLVLVVLSLRGGAYTRTVRVKLESRHATEGARDVQT